MKITVTKHDGALIECSFNWYGKISYTLGHEIMFFADETQSDYRTAVSLSKATSTFFTFDFYEEVGVKCVMVIPAKDCTVSIK